MVVAVNCSADVSGAVGSNVVFRAVLSGFEGLWSDMRMRVLRDPVIHLSGFMAG